MTRRTFIAFLTALLPSNWLRREAPRMTAQPIDLLTGRIVTLKPRRVGGSEWHREWMRYYGGDARAFYSEPPPVNFLPSHGPGLCDLAYRKP